MWRDDADLPATVGQAPIADGRTQGLLRNAPLLKVYSAVNSWLPMLEALA